MGIEPLNTCHWSPHPPFNLIATAGYAGTLDIIDCRVSSSSPPVWTSARSHKGGIFDVQFNPVIPYWIASAGEDGTTNIWDIRCGHPVSKIEGHNRRVNSVCTCQPWIK
jgi:WD40 repeat protein